MNRTQLSAIALAITLTGVSAMAADASVAKTREQVKAELTEAIRTGDIVTNGETNQKANELFPHLYPAKVQAAGKTRDEVKAELAEAIRTGDILVMSADSSLKANEVTPNRYPAKPVAKQMTREQVKAELAEAVRNGDMLADNESGLKLNQVYPQRYRRS